MSDLELITNQLLTMTRQLELDFDGPTYDRDKDKDRLSGQFQKVFDTMRDGQWRTLDDITVITGYPNASISARLRDFRKDKFGKHTVERRRVAQGLFEYRLIVNQGVMV